MAASATTDPAQSGDLPPDVRAALQRIRDGSRDPADLDALRRALAAGQVQIVSGDRAVAVGASVNDAVIVTGDGNVITIIKGAASDLLAAAEYDRLTQRYLASVAERWSWLAPEETGSRIPLTDVYVMLEALPVPPPKPLSEPPDLPAELHERLEHAGLPPSAPQPPPRPVALAEALGAADHLVILGEPGAGKSTTLQFIGLCFARQVEGWAQQKLNLHENRVPLLIALRDLDPGQTIRDALEQAVFRALQDNKANLVAGQLIDHWRDANRLIILLDGLDEARDPGWVRRAIADLAASPLGRHARIVVASRRAGYVPLGASFRDYTLKPFDKPAEAEAFLAGWLNVLNKPGAAAKLLGQLSQQPALRRLLDNPLILRLCAEVYAASGEAEVSAPSGKIVRNRADLYEQYLHVLKRRAIKRRKLTEKACAKLWCVAEALAWHWHSGGANDEAATWRAVQQTGLATDECLVDKLLYDLRTPLGLIVRVDGRYAFAHQTMREYMVARRLRAAWKQDERRTRAFLRPRLHLPEWREPLALLVGGLPDDEAQRLLTWIMRARSPCERWLKRDLLLAAELVAESGKPVPEGMYPALLRAFRRWSPIRTSVVEVLGQLGNAQAVPTLLAALRDDNKGVRQAAKAALKQIHDPQVVEALLAAPRDADIFWMPEEWALLQEIRNPQAVPALLAALRDADADVRWAAVKALGAIGDAQAAPQLLTALRDDSKGVRYAAAEALGEIGDAQAVPALLVALRDDDKWVRYAAARALEEIGDAQAVPHLLVALRDAAAGVRQAAAAALGAIGDAQAVPALSAALHDRDEDVRRAAVKA
ncbi:MAG: HEAT repeat domain-containing protein, partial [Roseiflexus sp.]|nr:HEAT repeat domain-containing protein [Roseiflexus sp.]